LLIMRSEYNWLRWLFSKVDHGFWNDKANHKLWVKWFEQETNLKDMNEWYKVKMSQLREKGAGGLLQYHYGNSLIKMLQSVYPGIFIYTECQHTT
jgi:hypothetical protein